MSGRQTNPDSPSSEVVSTGEMKPPERTRKRHRGRNFILLSIFLFLVALVIVGGILAKYTLFVPKPKVITFPPGQGAYVLPPLSSDQLAAIRHLPEDMQYQKLAQLYISHMTLDEKLGQLFMVQALTYNDSANTPDTMYMLNQLHAGGIIMYAIQMNSFDQTKDDIEAMQLNASTPLIVSTDEEGGFVERVQNIFGDRPGALQTYETGNVNNATKLGQGISRDLQSLGINDDIAPDVDVQQVDGPDQYLRTWGYTAASVIQYGGAYLRAIQSSGEIATLKHFPGLGAAKTDAHTSLPTINSSKDHIYSVDLAPYQTLLASSNPLNHPDMVMTTDLMMPALDPQLPAELSPDIITGILRDQFHYNGVVITDALWMDGIAQKWNLVQASLMALNAGDDMLLGAIGSAQMIMVLNGLKSALSDGQLTMSRVNQAVTRIIALKMSRHIIPIPWSHT